MCELGCFTARAALNQTSYNIWNTFQTDADIEVIATWVLHVTSNDNFNLIWSGLPKSLPWSFCACLVGGRGSVTTPSNAQPY